MIVNTKSETRFLDQSDSIKRFITDIRKTKILTKDEEIDVVRKVLSGDKMAREKLIVQNQKFIFSVAKRFAPNNNQLLDIVNEANIGFINAIPSFKEHFDVRFCSYAVYYMRKEINLYLLSTNTMIKQTNFNKTYGKTKKIKNTFFLKNGRYPSDLELIELLNERYGCNLKDTNDVIDMIISSFDSSAHDIQSNDCGDDNVSVIDRCGYSVNDYIAKEEDEHNKHVVQTLLQDLDERENSVLRMSFGIGYDRPFDYYDIAQKVGITTERVRQIRYKALTKLKHYKVA